MVIRSIIAIGAVALLGGCVVAGPPAYPTMGTTIPRRATMRRAITLPDITRRGTTTTAVRRSASAWASVVAGITTGTAITAGMAITTGMVDTADTGANVDGR